MYAKQTRILNPTGLHARPASDFAIQAKTFTSKITIRNLEESNCEAVNAKSIVSLLGESMGQGTRVEIAADGPDEKQAVDALVEMMESGFGE